MVDTLNPAQQQAAYAGDGPVLIVAGPGTGKTKTLTARIAHLLQSGVKPEQILALSFTKKAAEEMRERVQALVPSSPLPTISTFHALCAQILQPDKQLVGEPARLVIIKSLPKPMAFKGLTTRDLGLLISRSKNMAEDNADLAKLTAAYDAALAEQNLMDFDDLLLHTRNLLLADNMQRKKLNKRFAYILVDEFQDTNKLQYELLNLLRGNDNVFAIGDPRQSIYGFRGASGTIFDQFAADYPQVTQVTLSTNYRSVPEVVRLANAIFVEAPDLQAAVNRSGTVQAVQTLNEYAEAAWVLGEIQHAIGGSDLRQAVSDDATTHRSLRDFAIVYRNRAASVVMKKMLDESGLPYQVVGDGSPYEQPQVQALIALLTTAATGKPLKMEGYTSATIRTLQDRLADSATALPGPLAEQLADLLGFAKTKALTEFFNSLVQFKSVTAAAAHFDRVSEQGFYDPNVDTITLLTIHASKGLEFPHVFLLAAEDGILPHTKANVEEEKRLFFVAATRAKERLDILHTKSRGGQAATLSTFVREISEAIVPRSIDAHLAQDERRAAKRKSKRSQQSLF